PDVLPRPESLSWNRDHMGFVQEPLGHITTRMDAALPKVRRNVWIDIEGALGFDARDTRNLAEQRERLVAQADVFGLHIGDALLRPGERGDCCLLDHVRGTGRALALQLGHGADDWRRGQRVSKAPASHRVSLRKGACYDQMLLRVPD